MSSTTTTTGAGLEGVVAGESEICYIDGYAGILSYRGYNIHTLAEHATFEEAIYLLWKGSLPKQAELDQLKRTWPPIRAAREVVDVSGGRSQGRFPDGCSAHRGFDVEPVRSRSRRICRRTPTEEGREADGANLDHRHHLRPAAQWQARDGGRSEARLRRQLPLHADRQAARTM